MVWNKIFHKSKSSNQSSKDTTSSSNGAGSVGGGTANDKLSEFASPALSLPCTPKLKKKTKLKSVFSSLSLRSSSSSSKKSIIAQNSIFNDASIYNDNYVVGGVGSGGGGGGDDVHDDDDVTTTVTTKLRAEAIVEDKLFNFCSGGSIKDDDDHRPALVNRFPSHESSSSPTPPPIPPPPTQRSIQHRSDSFDFDDRPTQPPPVTIPPTPPNLSLHPCPICARTFVPATLAKHVGICEKMTQKKRKKFDSSRQRREGTDLALLPPKPEHMKVTPSKAMPTPVQKKRSSDHITVNKHQQQQQQQQQQHEQQQQNHNHQSHPSGSRQTRERRDSLPARLENNISAPAVTQPSKVKRRLAPVTDQCPHCERFFGIKAYERHVEWCKEKSRITNGHHTNNTLTTVAKERLEARTKYRAPPLKTRRALNREKYSGYSGGSDDMSTNSISELPMSPTEKSPKILPNQQHQQQHSGHRDNAKQSLQNSMTSSTTSEGRRQNPKEQKRREKNLPLTIPVDMTYSDESFIYKQTFSSEHTSLQKNLHVTPYVSSQIKIREANMQKAEEKDLKNEQIMSGLQKSKLKPKRKHQADSKNDNGTAKNVVTTILPPKENFETNRCESEIFKPPFYHNDEPINIRKPPPTIATGPPIANATTNNLKLRTFRMSALSDSYDPFISAKRQLEELFSPSTTSTPTTNPTKSYTQPTTSSMSRSINLNAVKSNFKRTSSLRLPKTTTHATIKPSVSNLFAIKKPSIQRGISVDEGPISSSFLKSSEFDELPVKAAYVTPITPHHQRAIQMRDPNSVRGRKTSHSNYDQYGNKSTDTTHEISKTDSLAVFLKYEHELSMNPSVLLTEKEIKDKNNSFSKRLSNISQSSSSNNSSDNLNGSAKMMTTSSTSTSIDPKLINLCDNLPINITKLSDNDNSSTSDSTIDLNFASTTKNVIHASSFLDNNSVSNCGTNDNNSSNGGNSNNRNSTESRRLKRSLKLSKENFLFDNSNSSDNTSNDKNNSNSNNKDNSRHDDNKNDEHYNARHETINSCDRSNEMIADNNSTSSIKLTTDKLFDDFDLDEFISSFDDDENFPIFKDYKEFIRQTNTITKCNSNNSFRASKENLHTNNNNNNNNKNSSNYNNHNTNEVENELSLLIKQIQLSNSSSCNNNSNDSNNNQIDNNDIDNDDDDTSCNSNTELIINNDSDSNPCNDELDHDDHGEGGDTPRSTKKLNDLNDAADKELLRSITELDRLCESSASNILSGGESDEISSVDSFPMTGKNISGSKFSADSAYGSLSRHSPEEPVIRSTRNPIQRTRQYQGNTISANPNNNNNNNNSNNNASNNNNNNNIMLEKISKTKIHTIPLNNNRIIMSPKTPSPNSNQYHNERNSALSSSESETSLPPIATKKIELVQHSKQRGGSTRGDSVSPIDCKMSKFCHECGNKFLLATAKFCMECGVRRALLE